MFPWVSAQPQVCLGLNNKLSVFFRVSVEWFDLAGYHLLSLQPGTVATERDRVRQPSSFEEFARFSLVWNDEFWERLGRRNLPSWALVIVVTHACVVPCPEACVVSTLHQPAGVAAFTQTFLFGALYASEDNPEDKSVSQSRRHAAYPLYTGTPWSILHHEAHPTTRFHASKHHE